MWGQRLRLGCQKPTDIISPTEIGEKPLPHISHCALTPKGGPERIIACADKATLLLTCSWMWLSYYQEGSLKRRWEEPGFERWVRSCRDHLQLVATHPPHPTPSAQPLSLLPDRSINHSVTEIVTQSACNAARGKCEKRRGLLRHCR